MLVFLILCAFLRTLHGASLPPPNTDGFSATINIFNVVAREAPVASDERARQLRTVYDIVKSCLLTIFTCVWTSIHPNINGPRNSWWTCMKRRGIITLYAVVAPELILFWALNQRKDARKLMVDYNKLFAKAQTKETTLWGKFVGLFRPLPKETTWRGDGQSWTTTHGFFIQMGGFILYDAGSPKEVLGYERLEELLRNKAIDAPTVTKRDLQDRSKSDTVSNTIAVLQTTWFVFQCIVRTVQHLPVSELEVLTLAFAVMNAAIYAVWWDKPQGVDMAICVPLKRAKEEELDGLAGLSHATETPNFPQPECRDSNDDVPLIQRQRQQSNEDIGQEHSWVRRMLREDREQYNSLVFFLFRLPYHIVIIIFHFNGKITHTPNYKIYREGLRMPMFYKWKPSHGIVGLASCTIGATFGAIHLLTWASHFPSPRDHMLWRISAVTMTVLPLLVRPLMVLTNMVKHVPIKNLFRWLFVLVTCTYIAARFVVIVIALKAIRDPPHDVLLDVSWTSYIPHF